MKKSTYLGTEVFGIPFDRHVRHTEGLNEKYLKKSSGTVWASFTVWEIFLWEKSSIAKGSLKGCRKTFYR